MFTGIIRDVTERERARAALEAAKLEAEQASRAKSQFLAVTSHEIRTPLNAIIGAAELAAMGAADDEQAELLDMLVRNAEVLLALISDVLDFAKINLYHVGMLPYFLEKLHEIEDGDATLLDRTMIVFGSPMADGNLHNHRRCPFVLLGGANGQLEGNLHLKAPDGTPMANVMLSLMHKLGMEDIRSFGDSTGDFSLTPPQTAAQAG